MNETILVPTDFSEVCNNAISHGAEIARKLDGTLLLLHVVNKDTRTYLKRIRKTTDYISVRMRNLCESTGKKHQVTTKCLVRNGSIFTEIRKVSAEMNAGLMVLGTHGKTGFQHLTGSSALRVITGVKIPVIVVQNRIVQQGYKKIIFPLGLDTDFMEKLEHSIDIARLFDAKIHLYHYHSESKNINRTLSQLTDLVTSRLTLEDIRFVKASAKKENHFAEQVLNYAIEQRADLIIIMTDNDEFESSFFTGRENEKMIYNLPQIPVMCVNPVK
ncbi:MAG: universal stress protein [Bacteroidales bacterium]